MSTMRPPDIAPFISPYSTLRLIYGLDRYIYFIGQDVYMFQVDSTVAKTRLFRKNAHEPIRHYFESYNDESESDNHKSATSFTIIASPHAETIYQEPAGCATEGELKLYSDILALCGGNGKAKFQFTMSKTVWEIIDDGSEHQNKSSSIKNNNTRTYKIDYLVPWWKKEKKSWYELDVQNVFYMTIGVEDDERSGRDLRRAIITKFVPKRYHGSEEIDFDIQLTHKNNHHSKVAGGNSSVCDIDMVNNNTFRLSASRPNTSSFMVDAKYNCEKVLESAQLEQPELFSLQLKWSSDYDEE